MSVVRKAEVMVVAKKTSQQPNTENGTVDISREGSLKLKLKLKIEIENLFECYNLTIHTQ